MIVKASQKDWSKVFGVLAVFGVLVGMAFSADRGLEQDQWI
jgi:hypothetical protein